MAVSKKKTTTPKAAATKGRGKKKAAPQSKRVTKKTAARAPKRSASRTAKRAPARAPEAAPRPASAEFAMPVAMATQAAQAAPKHLLIFLPGFMGSTLRDPDGNVVWLNFGSITSFASPFDWLADMFGKMQLPHPDPNFELTPHGVMENLFGGLPFGQHYGRLRTLLTGWGYKVNPELPMATKPDNPNELKAFTFPYDWRKDLREAAVKLKARVEQLRALHPEREIWLMGHSGGGIVSRWYIKHLGGDQVVKRLFLLASPWDGAPGALYSLFHGLDKVFDFSIPVAQVPETTRKGLRLLPAIYEILPQKRDFLLDAAGAQVNPFDDAEWLDAAQRELLTGGREFNQELGNDLANVPTVVFIGYNKKTRTQGRMTTAGNTRWSNLRWIDNDFLGDGTVPVYSAEYPKSSPNHELRLVYVIAAHSDIYANPEVQRELFRELLGKFSPFRAAELDIAPRGTDAAVAIEPAVPFAGEQVAVSVILTVREEAAALKPLDFRQLVPGQQVSANLRWQQPLPLSKQTAPTVKLHEIQMQEDRENPGRYKGTFKAPAHEGIYELETIVNVENEPEFTLIDSVIIQAKPKA